MFHFFKIFQGWRDRRQKKAQSDKKPCCALYLMNHTSYGLQLWYTCKKRISPFFYIFSKFLGSVVWWKAKNGLQMTKIYFCHTPYLRKLTSFYHGFCYTCVKRWHLQIVFSFFFKIVIFQVVRAKYGTKWLKEFVSLCISGTIPHMIGFWCTCGKWWYLQQFLLIFQSSDFLDF